MCVPFRASVFSRVCPSPTSPTVLGESLWSRIRGKGSRWVIGGTSLNVPPTLTKVSEPSLVETGMELDPEGRGS